MKTELCIFSATALAFAAFAAARPLTVGAPDGDGKVAVTIGGTGTGDQTLVAAWANGDKGGDPLAWTEYADAGTIAPDCTSTNFTIPAAWRAKSGAVRFFLMSGSKPYGTRYECITRPSCSDGGLYINTGIVPDSTLDITVRFQSPNFKAGAMVPFGIHKVVNIFSAGGNNDNMHFYFFGAGNSRDPSMGMQIGADDTNVFGEKPPKDNVNPHTFRLCRDGIFIDGYRHLGPFNPNHFTNTTTSAIALFGRNGSWKQSGTTCSIYGATIVTNGVLAADLVPAITPVGRKVAMWNRVTREWKSPAGTQKDTLDFTPGNDIGPYPPDCGTVESASSAVMLAPTIAVVAKNAQDRTATLDLGASHDAGLLFAVAGAVDAGTEFSAWATNVFVQKIAADAETVTVSLPDAWWRNKYQVRFAWKSIVGLPYDREVAYIHADGNNGGTNFCRTGWTPTTNTTIRVNAKTGLSTCSFGIEGALFVFPGTKDQGVVYYGFFKKPDGSTYSNDYAVEDISAFVTDFHVLQIGPGGVFIDDLTTPKAALSGYVPTTVTANICLPFRARSLTNHTGVTKDGKADVKLAKIWEGDILVRDFVPCVKNDVPGFYDKVKDTFYPSVTSKPFVAGDTVTPADGDLVGWSGACSLATGFQVIIR